MHVLGPKDVIWWFKKKVLIICMIKVVLKFPLHNAITKSTWYSPMYTQAAVKIAQKNILPSHSSLHDVKIFNLFYTILGLTKKNSGYKHLNFVNIP